jgi:hypothetical protein
MQFMQARPILVAGDWPMMSPRDRQARRPDMTVAAFRDAMQQAGFVAQPRGQFSESEWTHPDTGTRRFCRWRGELTNLAFRRLIDELDAGRTWNGTKHR